MNNGNESGNQKKYLTADIIVLVIILVILGIITFLSFSGKVFSKDKLTITANLSIVNENTWKMRGRVIFDDGVPVDSARVWVILKGKGGNDDSPPTGYTKKDGEFDFDSLPIYVGVTTLKSAQSLRELYKPKRGASPNNDAEGDTSRGEVARGDTSSSEYRDRVKEVNVNVYLPDKDIKGEKKIILGGSGFSPDQIHPRTLQLDTDQGRCKSDGTIQGAAGCSGRRIHIALRSRRQVYFWIVFDIRSIPEARSRVGRQEGGKRRPEPKGPYAGDRRAERSVFTPRSRRRRQGCQAVWD